VRNNDITTVIIVTHKLVFLLPVATTTVSGSPSDTKGSLKGVETSLPPLTYPPAWSSGSLSELCLLTPRGGGCTETTSGRPSGISMLSAARESVGKLDKGMQWPVNLVHHPVSGFLTPLFPVFTSVSIARRNHWTRRISLHVICRTNFEAANSQLLHSRNPALGDFFWASVSTREFLPGISREICMFSESREIGKTWKV
jgi:hypothetical protein